MKAPRRAGPMSLDALEQWFDHAKPEPDVSGVSMMDGFLTGVAVGPVFVHPETWLWHLIGEHEKRAYAGTKADAAVQAIVGHYNMVRQVLDYNPARYAPIFMRTDAGEVSAEHWANGFYGALKLNIPQWKFLFETLETAGPLATILSNCTEADGTPIYGELSPNVPRQAVADTWRMIPDVVIAIKIACASRRALSEDLAFAK